jgi:23S rRNA (pseudouridine1915-N3)-methyltransferase
VKIALLAVGKLKEPAFRALADDYIGRIRRYVPVEEREIKNDAALAQASARYEQRIACEVHGRSMSSSQFAAALERWGRAGKGEVCFLIGGAEGIPPALSKAAQLQLSLSPMTLPHRLARVVLYEQIYRAFSILRGEPYARE